MTQPITIYTTSTCPFCINAKRLLENKGFEYTDYNYRTLSESDRAELATKTNNYRTVPQIFIGDTFVGGFDQLNQLNQQGKLDELVNR